MNFEKEEQEIETTTINDSSLSGTNNKTDHNVRRCRKEQFHRLRRLIVWLGFDDEFDDDYERRT